MSYTIGLSKKSKMLYNFKEENKILKKEGELVENLLTFSEAREMLGNISSSTFKTYVDSKRIRKVVPPGKTQGRYIREDIEELAKEIQPFTQSKRRAKDRDEGETDWIESSDMGNMYNLEYTRYGDETGNPSIIRKWYERNPQVCRVLFNKEDRRDFWGAINMLPLEEETIFKLLKGEMRDIDLNPQKDILTFEKPGTYNFYVASVIMDPERRQHFPLLVRSLLDFWCEQAPDRKIGKIYGRVVSEDGEMMAKKLFFSPVWSISDTAYALDIDRPNPSRIVQSFQNCLMSKE